jgi:hypothetical protein
MSATIFNLSQYGLKTTDLRSHSERMVSYSISLVGPELKSLLHLKPKQRIRKIQSELRDAVDQLTNSFDYESFTPRSRDIFWTIDIKSSVDVLRKLYLSPLVKMIHIVNIEGLKMLKEKPKLTWFSVRASVAIQVEDQTKGLQEIEDRIVLLQAYSFDNAIKRLESEWKTYAEPYLNSDGELVRWQLEEIVDVFELIDEIDPKGTEVWSSLKRRRMKKSYEWHGE